MTESKGARDRLIEIVRRRSFSKGHETKLVSGRSSTFYFNMKPSMLDPEGGHLIASLILETLKGADVDLIGGLEMGAVPLAVAVAVTSQITGWPLRAFFVRKQAKEHGARKLIEGLAPEETLAGQTRRRARGRDDHRRFGAEGDRGAQGRRRRDRGGDFRGRPAGRRRGCLQGGGRSLHRPVDRHRLSMS